MSLVILFKCTLQKFIVRMKSREILKHRHWQTWIALLVLCQIFTTVQATLIPSSLNNLNTQNNPTFEPQINVDVTSSEISSKLSSKLYENSKWFDLSPQKLMEGFKEMQDLVNDLLNSIQSHSDIHMDTKHQALKLTTSLNRFKSMGFKKFPNKLIVSPRKTTIVQSTDKIMISTPKYSTVHNLDVIELAHAEHHDHLDNKPRRRLPPEVAAAAASAMSVHQPLTSRVEILANFLAFLYQLAKSDKIGKAVESLIKKLANQTPIQTKFMSVFTKIQKLPEYDHRTQIFEILKFLQHSDSDKDLNAIFNHFNQYKNDV